MSPPITHYPFSFYSLLTLTQALLARVRRVGAHPLPWPAVSLTLSSCYRFNLSYIYFAHPEAPRTERAHLDYPIFLTYEHIYDYGAR